MKLISYLPDYSQVTRSRLVDGPVDTVKRLTLGITHVVSGQVSCKERVGEGVIHYNLDFAKKATFGGKMTVGGNHFIGVQSADYLHAQLQELRPRTSYAVEHVASGKFDLRAFLYVLGAAAAGGAGPCVFDTPTRLTAYKTLSTGWMVPSEGELTVGPNLVQTADQFATLSALGAVAGVSNITFLTDFIPGTQGNVLTGRALSKFAIRVAMNFLSAAHDCFSYAAHRVAFECGKTSVMTLNAHSDEGGWIRAMLRAPTYPPSTGIVSCMGREFIGFPLQESVDPNECLRIVVAGYLEAIALLHPADVLSFGTTSFYEKEAGGTGKPSDFDVFVNDANTVLHKWRELLCDLDGLHHDSTSDVGSFQGFFNSDKVERHLSAVDVLIPWWWVEPAPLLTMDIPGYFVPCAHGKITTLPMFKAENVHHNSPVLDSSGRTMPNSRVWVDRKPGPFREEGASYLYSPAYHGDNGLGQFVKTGRLDGTQSAVMGFVDNGTVNLADMRWVTPHNPLPCPLEGIGTGVTTFMMHATRVVRDPTPAELMYGKVESRLGRFFCLSDSPTVTGKTHKDVPEHIKRSTKRGMYRYLAIQPLKIVSMVAAPVAEQPAVEPEEPDTPPGPVVSPQPVSEDTTPDPKPDAVRVPAADAGVKPILPPVRTAGIRDDESGNGGGGDA